MEEYIEGLQNSAKKSNLENRETEGCYRMVRKEREHDSRDSLIDQKS